MSHGSASPFACIAGYGRAPVAGSTQVWPDVDAVTVTTFVTHLLSLSLSNGFRAGIHLRATALVQTRPLLHQLPSPVAVAYGFSSLSLSQLRQGKGFGG